MRNFAHNLLRYTHKQTKQKKQQPAHTFCLTQIQKTRKMQHTVARYIARHTLLPDGARVLVALSGGADSVALLHILHRLRYDCIAVHCNFHLRGEESMRDQYFVEALCKRLNIPLQIVEFDTEKYARKNKVSIEMAARTQRYTAFEQIRTQQKALAIAVAHHRDDSAETLLLNLMRGCGLRGLHGIRPRNGYIIRPLLCIDRSDILQYLKVCGEKYITDSTNLKSDYTRNKIRLEILPLMAQINPSILQTLAETAERIAEAENIYDSALRESITHIYSGNRIDLEAIKNEPSPQTLLHEILAPLGFNSAQTADIIGSIDSGCGQCYKSADYTVIKDRNQLIVTPNGEQFGQTITLPQEGDTSTPYGTIRVRKEPFDGTIPKQHNIATLDARKVALPLILRPTKRGDRFAPFGMRGSKLVSDYLTDRKRSIIEKQRQFVVTDAHDNILWLVDERPSAKCSIDGQTTEVICLEWFKQ